MRNWIPTLFLSLFALSPIACSDSGGGGGGTAGSGGTSDASSDASKDVSGTTDTPKADVSGDTSAEVGPGSIVVSKISGDTKEDGTKANFTIVLSSQPKADVTVNFDSNNKKEGTVDKTKVTFTSTNWNAPQTVTVTGVDDDVADGNVAYGIAFTATTSTDAAYNGQTPATVAVNNVDNDKAGVTLGMISGKTGEDGKTATFTVVLNSQPSADVVFHLDSDNKKEGTVDKTALTFTAMNWKAPQTVTVTGVDDTAADGDQNYNIVFSATTSMDAAYAAITPPKVAVTNVDNEKAGITVSMISGKTGEDGKTATFTAVLNAQPSADVVLHFDSNDKTEGTVDKTALTFTTANWNAPQTVTVTGIDDNMVDGDQPYAIVFTATTSTDAGYAGITPSNVAVINVDNDTGNITVSDISRKTGENGQQATFTAVLNAQPTANVVLHFDSNDKTEGTVDKTSLTFTTANWNAPQTVTVTGVDDQIADGPQTYAIVFQLTTSTDANYNGVVPPNVAVINVDDDSAGIEVAVDDDHSSESGGQASFDVVLNSQPTANVVVHFDTNKPGEGTPDKTSLTFTAVNWNAPQTVTVTGVDDNAVDGDQTYAIVFTATTSTDTGYAGIIPPSVALVNTDNDSPGVEVSEISGPTNENGGQASFTVNLRSQPTADVVVHLDSDDLGEGTVNKTTLTFTAVNWNAPQQVRVTGVDDNVVDGNQPFDIVFTASTSTDTNYSGIVPASVHVINNDNDTASFVVSTISGNTGENGAQATFTVRLNTQPSADVNISFDSDDTGEGTVNPTTLTFTNANWNAPQTVTATGVDDNLADGTQPYHVVFAASTSADTNYNGLTPGNVDVSNTDNDSPGVTIGPISGNVKEDGTQATFTIVLNSQPFQDVTVRCDSNDLGEGTLDKNYITFTSANWNAPQTVTVTGQPDNFVDGDQSFLITFRATTSNDTGYAGIVPASFSVINVDDDTVGYTVSAISGDTSESGGTATFSVQLNSIPTATVTVNLNSNDLGEGTVDKTALVFTTANWNAPQVVTVTGVNDDLADGLQPYQIVFGATTGSDVRYNAITPANIDVNNVDNDTAGITVSTISNDTSEGGGTATFTVVLNTQPFQDVTVHFNSNDTGEGTVGVTSLTFTALNWAVPQTVTVTGVNDNLADGLQPYAIVFTATTSTDAAYAAITPGNVDVNNTDNDTAGISVSAMSGHTTEGGGTATFTITLNSQPFNDVTVNFDSNNANEGTLNKTSATFTSGNWNVPQLVTATGVNDSPPRADGNQVYAVVFTATTSADPAYAAITPGNVVVTNDDNDSAGITVSAISGHTTEAGGTATFSVVLVSQPFADVTVHFDSNDMTEGTVGVTSLTFTTGNWNVPQTVTVTGVDDALNDCHISYAIVFTATTSTDAAYAAITPANVTVVNDDDENNSTNGWCVNWTNPPDVVNAATCGAWTNYINTLSGTYSSITFFGTGNPTGFTCSSSMLSTQICNALKNRTTTTVTCDGNVWRTGTICTGGSTTDTSGAAPAELTVNHGLCTCGQSQANEGVIRACYAWTAGSTTHIGGMGALSTCSNPSQIMSFRCNP